MGLWDDEKYDHLWKMDFSDFDCSESLLDWEVQIDNATRLGLWLDRKGKLYEMSELQDHHIMSILRMQANLPAAYTPLVHLVRAEKARRDKARSTGLFEEEMV